MESSIRRTPTDDGTATVTVLGEIDVANGDELAQGDARHAADVLVAAPTQATGA